MDDGYAEFTSLPQELKALILSILDSLSLYRIACASNCFYGVKQQVQAAREEQRKTIAAAAQTMAAGDMHSACISDGCLFTFGTDENRRGYLGHPFFAAAGWLLPTRVLVAGEVFVAVATHSLHTLALTASGCVYSFGHGDCGKLGHGDETTLSQPRLIEHLLGVRAISVGQQHSLVLTNGGQLFSFGSGFGGKLGHGDQRNSTHPRAVAFETSTLPTSVETSGEGTDQVVLECLASGTQHSLVATRAAGEVFTFGAGGSWQLGHGERQDEHKPRRLEGLRGTRIVAIAGGEHHSLAVDDDGRVYSWGAGEARERSSNWQGGWLGHRTIDDQKLPRLIAALGHVRVVCVAAGSRHSLLLTDGGAVFSCGDGDGGQLGHSHDELGAGRMLWVPTQVRSIGEEARCAIAVAAGETHSLCLLDDGQLMAWGCGSALGLEASALSDHAADQPASWGSAGNYEWAPGDAARRWQAREPALLVLPAPSRQPC